MKIYILGICGTFMAGLAQLARAKGYDVLGSDAHVYPPMSNQLADAGIEVREGYYADNLDRSADLFVIGNAMSRGNEQVEAILNEGLPYTSGPQWLFEHVLLDRWVLAIAGTHGKTTTSAMLAWILQQAGLEPGYLIGGATRNFQQSARLGKAPFFVIEADEYDTAFFDKRSKFVHYHPRTLILNNLEFDHADIFDDLAAIQRQFHHLLRIVPGNGLVIHNTQDRNLDDVIEMGCWTPLKSFGCANADLTLDPDHGSVTEAASNKSWPLKLAQSGVFNQLNASAALLAAQHAGVPIEVGVEALQSFAGVKRRQEIIGQINGITVYDDFAHHPTAIRATLQALKPVGSGRLIAVFEPRSNTMKMGVHAQTLAGAFEDADEVLFFDNGELKWDTGQLERANLRLYSSIDVIIEILVNSVQTGDNIVIMSNGGFAGIHQQLLQALSKNNA